MTSKTKAGRPTVITAEVLQKLEYGFTMGLSDREACLYAGICPSTLYNYCNSTPEFLERKELLKEQPKVRAKFVICDAIEQGNVATARWYLERKCKDEFSTKYEVDGTLAEPVQIIDDLGLLDE